ncbi:2-amino-4-hydroxy-6- hydroxymethyldihydropteridine pyrophosphokinase [Marinobacterium lacunae]|uniref:2-amino-4-hydroxy-6-hydroxymethyldihydropteridine pyrophosphokinase n=1 Tax=Marinobacterium lacunae TaxID=1232683 RepID=A0A081G296_9GAMM|nr:2-amino-4-hydroxy-6-hydroxymethyldihydropteridine diphosphokinase [Marinobacterium lacunae]KEA64901.1 2-amino-4-hydroxy-6- hydroxymethyldihydropteridine pyrophosphokinase [Marinobacterium lacunae]
MTDTIRCFIGLGSNLDDPRSQVQSAFDELDALEGCTPGRRSSLYRSDPVGPQDQPDFINAVVELFTELPAETLLDRLQSIEQAHRRIRERHWGPRTLDLDLLLYGNQVIETSRLTVPHAFMHERGFVLWPLAEIASDLILPDGTALDKLLALSPMGTLERLPL